MTLMRRDPFADTVSRRHAMDRLFEQSVPRSDRGWLPDDVYETPTELVASLARLHALPALDGVGRPLDPVSRRPATLACEINPTGQILWRCHTHGAPALRQGPCLATTSDRRLARLASLVRVGSEAQRAIACEQHVRTAQGNGEARVWASQAMASRLCSGQGEPADAHAPDR